MNLILSNATDRPIYEQIYHQIRDQVLGGTLVPGQPLPSIRALAKDLRKLLPKYMLPKQIHCISQFPVTNSNKTDRKKIAELIKEKKL